MELLLEKDRVQVNQPCKTGDTPLFQGAYYGHEKVVKLLLEKQGIEINQANNNGNTPLSMAAQNGHEKVVDILLNEHGIQVNQSWETGATPLFQAAMNGHVRVVMLLLDEKCIQVSKARTDGCSPLEIALQQGHHDIASLLKERLKRPMNQTLTCIVCLSRKPDVVLVPCGHQQLCGPCAYELNERQNICPVDRITFSEILPLEVTDEPTNKKQRL